MFSGPSSIPIGLVRTLYRDVSDLAFVVWVTWHESSILQPPAPTVSCGTSLANFGIYSFVILIIYWLVDSWGCYGSCVSIGSGTLFSILLLCRIMDITCCMAMALIASNVYFILSLGILNVFFILSIEGMCVAALAPPVMTISGIYLPACVDNIVY